MNKILNEIETIRDLIKNTEDKAQRALLENELVRLIAAKIYLENAYVD